MSFTEKLCRELKYYNDVIIYGYKDIGKCLLEYIIDVETNIKIANYSGKVKFFSTSNNQILSERKEIKGIKIKPIRELTAYKTDALVIVATQEQHHDNITKILDECGFLNRLFIKHEDYCELREKRDNNANIRNNRIGQYHLNHRIKLEHLRQKIQNGGKVKVLFMVHDAAVFGAASVYRYMEQIPLFEPCIYVISRRDVVYDGFLDEVQKDVRFFENLGYRVICGYDKYGTLWICIDYIQIYCFLIYLSCMVDVVVIITD